MRILRRLVAASVAGLVLAGGFTALTPAQATGSAADPVRDDHVSIYAGKIPELVDAGWAPCAGPVTWSVDPGSLTAAQLRAETARLRRALRAWSGATGLRFSYLGVETMAVDGPALQVGPTGSGSARPRHIYVAFRGGDSVPAFVQTVYGYAAPTLADRGTRQISGGFVLIRTDRVRDAAASDPQSLSSLYLHELGHVLGLGHAKRDENVMFPIVTDQLHLGAGDVTGVQQLLSGCPGQAAT